MITADETWPRVEPRSGMGRAIVIFLSPLRTGEKRNFRCPNCGRLLFKYESEIILIVDSGDVPVEKAPVDTPCPRCKLLYRVLW